MTPAVVSALPRACYADAVTPERWHQIKPLFSAALDRPPAERAALLADVCAGDAALLAELESLIAAHDAAGGFLDAPAVPLPSQVIDAPTEPSQGFRIGPYEVIRELGRGAGTVPEPARTSQWLEARRSYERSLEIWIALRDSKKLAADQAGRPAEIDARLAQLATAAARRPSPP